MVVPTANRSNRRTSNNSSSATSRHQMRQAWGPRTTSHLSADQRRVTIRPLSPLSSQAFWSWAVTGIHRTSILEDLHWLNVEVIFAAIGIAVGIRHHASANQASRSLALRFEVAAASTSVSQTAGWSRVSRDWRTSFILTHRIGAGNMECQDLWFRARADNGVFFRTQGLILHLHVSITVVGAFGW